MNDSIQNTKQLIIIYFNTDEDEEYFSFNLIAEPSGSPILMNWESQALSTRKTDKVDKVLIDYGDADKSIISLVRDKQVTRINIHIYSFYEGVLGRCDTYKTSLFNSACKFTRFDLPNY